MYNIVHLKIVVVAYLIGLLLVYFECPVLRQISKKCTLKYIT